jgi:hypothetical protein
MTAAGASVSGGHLFRNPLGPLEIDRASAAMDRVERREPGVSADRSFRIGEMLAEHPAALDREAGFGKEKGHPLLIIAGQGRRLLDRSRKYTIIL